MPAESGNSALIRATSADSDAVGAPLSGASLFARRRRQEEHRAGDSGRQNHRNEGGPESVSLVQEHGEISVSFRHPGGDDVPLAYRIVD